MRTKLQRTKFLLDELKYSIENELYAHHHGGLRMVCIAEMLIDETYAGKSAKTHAAELWIEIDKLLPTYDGPWAETLNEILDNLNLKT